MSETVSFYPPQRRGLLTFGLIALALGGGSAAALLLGLRQQQAVGSSFLLLLALSVVIFLPLPFILYRAYALLRAEYRLERDGLRLRWGLRSEDIPLPEIEWVRRAEDLAIHVPLPRLAWPGALLGVVHVRDLGVVEFMASTSRTLVFVATSRRIFAISPEDDETFLRAFRRSMEMGSLTPISSASVLPAAYLSRVLSNRLARALLLAGLLLTLLVFLAAALIISTRATISLGFTSQGQPLEPVPAQNILLIPVLATFTFLIDLTAGMFLYRRANHHITAYLVWASSSLTAGLFLVAIFLLSRS